MNIKLTPDQAFDRDVPKSLVDDVMTAISEAAHEGEGVHGIIHILDQDRLDSINVRAEGIVTVGDKEYRFVVRDGNWNGTELEAWEESGAQVFEPSPRTQWALAPRPDLVSDAIINNRGSFLVAKWDALLGRPEISSIPGKYTYDRMMQPGSLVESHYKYMAAKYGFVLTDKEHADEIRARLNQEQP